MEQTVGGALERALTRARQRMEQGDGDWERAAAAWEEVRRLAGNESLEDVLLEGSLSAVDAWRRADRPEHVLSIVEEPATAACQPEVEALLWAHGAAALMEQGRLQEAEFQARRVLDLLEAGPVQAVVADTLAGVLFVSGQLEALTGLLEVWETWDAGQGVAPRFRRAQLARLQGSWNVAREMLLSGVQELEGQEGDVSSAMGSIWIELGRVSHGQGEPEEALEFLAKAGLYWQQSGRRSGAVNTELERAMISQDSEGHAYLPAGLDGHVAWSKDRGLVLLEAKARLARGLCRWDGGSDGAIEDLNTAVFLAEQSGAPLLSGRARLERHQRAGEPVPGDLERALAELQADAVLRGRAWAMLRQER